jgi:hypothetical protein
MTLKITEFHPEDVRVVMTEAGLMDQWGDIDKTLEMIAGQNTVTVSDEQGPVGVGGTMELWNGRHMAWAFVGERARAHPFALTRISRQVLNRVKGRIEASAREDVPVDGRWLDALNFTRGPLMRGFGPDGSDHRSFARFNEGD